MSSTIDKENGDSIQAESSHIAETKSSPSGDGRGLNMSKLAALRRKKTALLGSKITSSSESAKNSASELAPEPRTGGMYKVNPPTVEATSVSGLNGGKDMTMGITATKAKITDMPNTSAIESPAKRPAVPISEAEAPTSVIVVTPSFNISKILTTQMTKRGLPAVEVKRPNANIKGKGFACNHLAEASPSGASARVWRECMSKKVASTLALGTDLVIWNFGAHGTGKSSILGFFEPPKRQDGANTFSNQVGLARHLCADIFNIVAISQEQYEKNGEGPAWGTVTISATFTAVGTLMQLTRDCLVQLEPGKKQSSLTLREDPRRGFFLQGLTRIECASSETLLRTFEEGLRVSFSRGGTNSEPRSHRLFSVNVERVDGDGVEHSSTFNILDIAGHERPAPAAKSTAGGRSKSSSKLKANGNAEDVTLKAIGRVVGALADSRSHIPYRDSKLTRLLKEGFGGRASALCVFCVRSDDSAYDETSAMLTFMKRVQTIVNHPESNVFDRKAAIESYHMQRTTLAQHLGIKNPESLRSAQIELGMDSPMELVELRDVIVNIERLDLGSNEENEE